MYKESVSVNKIFPLRLKINDINQTLYFSTFGERFSRVVRGFKTADGRKQISLCRALLVQNCE